MIRRTSKLVLAAAMASGALIAPTAHAADDLWAGFTCGFTSTNDPSGQVVQDPNTQTGEVNAGPWAVTDAGGVPAESVSITCTIQINTGVHGAGGASRTSNTAGGVGILADTISYTALAGDDVYLCTAVSWTTTKGSHTELVDDDDDPTNGVSCSLATSVEA